MRFANTLAVTALTATLGLGCGNDGDSTPANPDSTPGGATDGGGLYACDKPGQACAAHNACAINAVCGEDLLCHPEAIQDCADDLECTEDICQGQGKCAHVPREGTCALSVKDESGKSSVKCFKEGETNPNIACRVCDPKQEQGQFKWSSANGGSCDDDNDCTKDDYCDDGSCKGTYYGEQCQDEYSCTEDVCDGKGGCVDNKLQADACLINGQCFKAGDTDAQQCNKCDPAQSQKAWTAITVHCLIGGKCYSPGETDDTGCGVCTPDKDPTNWTPLPDLCKIDGGCHKAGEKNKGGCGECDPATSIDSWVVKGDECYIEKACHKPGETDKTGCGACTPGTDKYGWTTIPNTCLISGICYKPGDKDATTCAECDPAASTTTWTVKGDVCLIGDTCYKPKEQDPLKCGECDPALSKTVFTPLPNKCLIGSFCYEDQQIDSSGCLQCVVATSASSWGAAGTTQISPYDFEDGQAAGWTINNSDSAVGWVVSNRRPAGGSYSLYYGDPATGNYNTPATANNGTAEMPEVTLAASKKAGLRFWIYLDVEQSNSYDAVTLDVIDAGTSKEIWRKDSSAVEFDKWVEVVLDLSTYAGKAIKLRWSFDTNDALSNNTEGVFIDDITIYHDC